MGLGHSARRGRVHNTVSWIVGCVAWLLVAPGCATSVSNDDLDGSTATDSGTEHDTSVPDSGEVVHGSDSAAPVMDATSPDTGNAHDAAAGPETGPSDAGGGDSAPAEAGGADSGSVDSGTADSASTALDAGPLACSSCTTAATQNGGVCTALATACAANSQCGLLATCRQQCMANVTCIDICTAEYVNGLADYEAFDACLCGVACAGPCGATCAP